MPLLLSFLLLLLPLLSRRKLRPFDTVMTSRDDGYYSSAEDLSSVNGGGAGVSIYPMYAKKRKGGTRSDSPSQDSDGEDEETKIMHFLSGVHTGKQTPSRMTNIGLKRNASDEMPMSTRRSKSWRFIKQKVLATTRAKRETMMRSRSKSEGSLVNSIPNFDADKSPDKSPDKEGGDGNAVSDADKSKQLDIVRHLLSKRDVNKFKEKQQAATKAAATKAAATKAAATKPAANKPMSPSSAAVAIAKAAADARAKAGEVVPVVETPVHRSGYGRRPKQAPLPTLHESDEEAKQGLLKVAASMAAHHTNYTTYVLLPWRCCFFH